MKKISPSTKICIVITLGFVIYGLYQLFLGKSDANVYIFGGGIPLFGWGVSYIYSSLIKNKSSQS